MIYVVDGPRDAELIARVVSARDHDAYAVLVRRYQQRIHGYVWRLCRDASLSDDLTQETFVSAWERLPSFRGEGSFEGWLLRIAHTTFLQHVRKRQRRPEVSLDTGFEAAAGAASIVPSDELPDLDRLLASLAPDIRSMMVLVYGIGLTIAEVAAIVGMPPGTVKSHLSRAKARLREQFSIRGAA